MVKDLQWLEHTFEEMLCTCPCHDPKHPYQASVEHRAQCCCPHRHVVPEACVECHLASET